MDKNLLLAVSLSIAVYAVWFGFIEKRVAPAPAAATSSLAKTAAAPSSAPAPSAKAAPSSLAPAPAKASQPSADDRTENARLSNADVKIRAHGAAVVSWQFHGPRGTVELINDPNPGFLSTFPDLDFKRDSSAPGLVFAAKRADGMKIVKEFLEGGTETLPRLRITMSNPGSKTLDTGEWGLSVGPALGTIATEEKENAKLIRALALLEGQGGLKGKVEVFKPGEYGGGWRWVGVDNRYFLAALLPSPAEFTKTTVIEGHQVLVSAPNAALAPGASRSWELPYYIGAKGHTWLSRYKAGLERSIDFGFFAQLGRFVLKVLNFLHKSTGNWGWSIILLTVLLQLVMFPLTYRSLKATTALKKLQPEIAKLQQRYGKDAARLNTETMALYKKHGANPLGGCLPMLVQMPVFIALFNALRNAWELHGASWIFWIHDLSAKDPYYVLPLIMGGLMFAQNKLNPAATDPAQAQMMTFMPIVFTFMFMNFPSGLVLYWLTNSLLSTLQQLALRDRLAAESGRAA